MYTVGLPNADCASERVSVTAGSKIDPAVKPFFQYDPQGAKQLLTAAGFPNGFSVNYHYTLGFGPDYAKAAELTGEFITKIGVKLNVVVEDYNSVYIPHTFRGDDYARFAL